MAENGEGGEKSATRPAVCIANAEPPARDPEESAAMARKVAMERMKTTLLQKRRAVEAAAALTGQGPECFVCKREFKSFKALFGHLRAHPDRNWRGAYPPRYNLKNPLRRRIRGGRTGKMKLDLNRDPPAEEDEEEVKRNSRGEGAKGLDLNKPLSPGEEN